MQGTNTITKPRQKSNSHWGLVVVTTIIAGLVGFGWMWWSRMTVMPVVTIPTPTLPSPNAFDIFVEASNNIQDERKIIEAMAPRPQHGQHVYTLNEKAQLVAKNAAVLKELRAGFQQDYLHPPDRSFNALYPEFARFRSMAHLLALEGQIRAGRGEWKAALSSDLDTIQFGLTIPRGMTVLGHLTGLACEAIGRKGVWERVERLGAAEAEAGARRLEAMLAQRISFSATLEEDKFALQVSLLEVFRDPNWRMRPSIFDSSSTTTWLHHIGDLPTKRELYLYSNRAILNNFTGYMDTQIVRSRQPYATRAALPPVPPDPVNQLLNPVFAQADLKDLCAKTQSGLLLLTLALHACYAEQRAYPQKLRSLVPNYLTKLPDDPFGHNAFLYKRKGDTYLLYSIGPDKRDDGGRPIDEPGKLSSSAPDARYRVRAESQGDIVSGVNRD